MASEDLQLDEFKMDVELFIIEIQNRPILWDQTIREYSNRNLKKQAWEKICDLFVEDFAVKTVKQKNEAGKQNIILYLYVFILPWQCTFI